MDCKHEHLRTVGDRLFCKDCDMELPLEFLTGGKSDGQKAPADEKTDKPTPKKKTARTAK